MIKDWHSQKPSSWRQFRTLLARDLRQELHTRDMLSSMGVYAVLVLIIFGATFSRSGLALDMLALAGGLLWALIVFTSLLGLNRSFNAEKADAALDGLLLIPMDRSVLFLAKACSNLIFLLVVEVVVCPLFYFFFLADSGLPLAAVWVGLPLLLGSIGMAGVGTLLATITSNAKGQDVLLAILFIPLLFPLLYAVVTATSVAITGTIAESSAFLISVVLAGGYDLIMLAVCWLLYDYIVAN
ncbi:MAG: heme exporter protein CcmB [Actinomycetia bacterium]|nr:heme exporter protein CcmB [Actinomycetes bacterium]